MNISPVFHTSIWRTSIEKNDSREILLFQRNLETSFHSCLPQRNKLDLDDIKHFIHTTKEFVQCITSHITHMSNWYKILILHHVFYLQHEHRQTLHFFRHYSSRVISLKGRNVCLIQLLTFDKVGINIQSTYRTFIVMAHI